MGAEAVFTKERQVELNYYGSIKGEYELNKTKSIQSVVMQTGESYYPTSWDLKDCLISILDYYRRKVNNQ